MAFIDLQRVTKNYKDTFSEVQIQVLNGIDLKIEQGTYNAIMGPSGAGKTTLLNLIGGNIKATTGSIFINDMPIHNFSERELVHYRRSFCGFLWQDPEDNLIPGMTVAQNLNLAMRIGGLSRRKRRARIDELLTKFEIIDRKNFRVHQISGGEALRASLAMALANEPILLLADEPTGELDIVTSRLIIDYLKEITRQDGTTVIAMTHDSMFEPKVDMTYYLNDGTISTVHNQEIGDKEKVAFMNAIGQIQVPKQHRDKHGLKTFVELTENEDGDLVVKSYNDKLGS